MHVKYCGPRKEIIVVPYGPHRKGAVKEYPNDFAEELLATSTKQQFEITQGAERKAPREPEPEPELTINDITVAQIKAELDEKGIEYDDKALKAELFELYQKAVSELDEKSNESFDQEALDR